MHPARQLTSFGLAVAKTITNLKLANMTQIEQLIYENQALREKALSLKNELDRVINDNLSLRRTGIEAIELGKEFSIRIARLEAKCRLFKDALLIAQEVTKDSNSIVSEAIDELIKDWED